MQTDVARTLRPAESLEAEWSKFGLDNLIWRIPPERMKKRKEHVIPLPTQAVEVPPRALNGGAGN
jgi:integrase